MKWTNLLGPTPGSVVARLQSLAVVAVQVGDVDPVDLRGPVAAGPEGGYQWLPTSRGTP